MNAQHENEPRPMIGPGSYPGMPRWVKVSALMALVFLLAVVVVLLTGVGGHGPARHLPSTGTAVSSTAHEDGRQP